MTEMQRDPRSVTWPPATPTLLHAAVHVAKRLRRGGGVGYAGSEWLARLFAALACKDSRVHTKTSPGETLHRCAVLTQYCWDSSGVAAPISSAKPGVMPVSCGGVTPPSSRP